jgi:putative ATPase
MNNHPLPDKLRPVKLADFVGQEHLKNQLKEIHSMLLYGPTGCGKTTLAKIIAKHSDCFFLELSAVFDGVKEVKEVLKIATANQKLQTKTVLFVDEIHRFNKAQQDAFLPHIESGLIYLIGATTQNPGFAINNAILSRVQVYHLKKLTHENLEKILNRALNIEKIKISKEVQQKIISFALGDARKLLNLLERVETLKYLSDKEIINSLGEPTADFDKNGDVFYHQLSAFHKSVRGSSPDGALYWFSRMLVGGCDPLVIARRLLAIASEDVGNADPRALEICLNAWDVYHRVGAKEGNRVIAQAAVYCAVAPKSNAVYLGFNEAMNLAKDTQNEAVPKHLCNAVTKLDKEEGVGVNYRYDHNEENAFSKGQTYLPDTIGEIEFYRPNQSGLEVKISEKLNNLRKK